MYMPMALDPQDFQREIDINGGKTILPVIDFVRFNERLFTLANKNQVTLRSDLDDFEPDKDFTKGFTGRGLYDP